MKSENLDTNKLLTRISGFEKFQKADYTNCKSFFESFLNTPDPDERKRLALEFKKRHTELYNFIENNQELISAEHNISKLTNGIFPENSENSGKTNFFEIIQDKLNDL
ncbi:MAG: hypothetical protein NC244_07225 [Alistipes senegalensis]|nr:hypothetical protein [Alistipes senegalensis]